MIMTIVLLLLISAVCWKKSRKKNSTAPGCGAAKKQQRPTGGFPSFVRALPGSLISCKELLNGFMQGFQGRRALPSLNHLPACSVLAGSVRYSGSELGFRLCRLGSRFESQVWGLERLRACVRCKKDSAHAVAPIDEP